MKINTNNLTSVISIILVVGTFFTSAYLYSSYQHKNLIKNCITGDNSFNITNDILSSMPFDDKITFLVELISEEEDFDDTLYISYLKLIEPHFPSIVYAKSRLETGHFSSKLFHTNNNMYGMKKANHRPQLASGFDKDGYAIYKTWKHSVLDYYIWQEYSAGKTALLSKDHYFARLDPTKRSYYGNDPRYLVILKSIEKQYLDIFE